MTTTSGENNRTPRDLLEVLQKYRAMRLDLPEKKLSIVLEYLEHDFNLIVASEITSLKSESSQPASSDINPLEESEDLSNSSIADADVSDKNSDSSISQFESSLKLTEAKSIFGENTSESVIKTSGNLYHKKKQIEDYLIHYFSQPDKLYRLYSSLKKQGKDKLPFPINEFNSARESQKIFDASQIFERILSLYTTSAELEQLSKHLQNFQSSHESSASMSVEAHSQQIDKHYGKPPIKAFISYSWKMQKAEENISRLFKKLRKDDGIDCECDLPYIDLPPKKGWQVWMENQIEEADFVLVIFSEPYLKSMKKDDDAGKGVSWETAIIRTILHQKHTQNEKFIPVVFSEADLQYIHPVFDTNRYILFQDYDNLCRLLTGQPRYRIPKLGRERILSACDES